MGALDMIVLRGWIHEGKPAKETEEKQQGS